MGDSMGEKTIFWIAYRGFRRFFGGVQEMMFEEFMSIFESTGVNVLL